MAGTFIIPTYNPLTFKDINALQPNFENTLSRDEKFDGVVNGCFVQKFIGSDEIRVQFYTDYNSLPEIPNPDFIEIYVIDQSNNQSLIPYFKVKEITGEGVFFYEFSITGKPLGYYYIAIKATRLGEPTIYKESEPFEIVESETKYDYAFDGTKFPVETIPNHIKVTASNNENQAFTWWNGERLTGDPFEVNFWVEGTLRKPQPAGEVDNYDNQGQLTVLKSIAQRVFEIKTADTGAELLMKLSECSGLDNFYVNNIQYTKEENFEIEYFGNYTSGVLTGNLTQKNVSGVNSDDQGISPIIDDEDMGVMVLEKDVIGSDSILVPDGNTINLSTAKLLEGTSATIKIGTTVGGDEILLEDTISNSNPTYTGLAIGNPTDIDGSYYAYIEVVGVGAKVKVRLQTIKNTQ